MSRYTSVKPKAEDWLEDRPVPQLPHPVAYESGPVDTGLKDVDGNVIYRLSDPIGFVRSSDA